MDLQGRVIGGVGHGERNYEFGRRTIKICVLAPVDIRKMDGSVSAETEAKRCNVYYQYHIRTGEEELRVWVPIEVPEKRAHQYIVACALDGAENVDPASYAEGVTFNPRAGAKGPAKDDV